jgi:hypothetical protein
MGASFRSLLTAACSQPLYRLIAQTALSSLLIAHCFKGGIVRANMVFS